MSHQQRVQTRDPIMDDDTFSLKFGNPIKIIHDIQPSNATAPTSMHHVPSYLPSLSTSSDGSEDEHDHYRTTATHHPQSDKKSTSSLHSRASSSSSVERDVANFAEFYHNQDGRVNEIDHI
ncbi:hypothetical protein BCR42DRAFT_414180 [Absidia repens]|uniref:Uncharacterized protein n=1 Tax=Absidia repens TaxID=90262 RepID=A0A1X2IIV4_9FUNG|nr:hypothetical protein BCR42DRAFT_414180 [Absidia repens]